MRATRLAALLVLLPASLWAADGIQRPIAPLGPVVLPVNPAAGEALKLPVSITPAGFVPAILTPGSLGLPVSLVPAEALLPPANVIGHEIGAVADPASADLGSRNGRDESRDRGALRAIEDWSAQQHEQTARGDLLGEQALGGSLFDAQAHVAPSAASLAEPKTVALPSGAASVTIERAADAFVGSYLRYIFHDRSGGKVVGIDLNSRPDLVDSLPELKPWERGQIKKIQAYTQDLRVLVLENTGKTPDLEIGGVVTELKTWPIDKMDLTHIVNKANSQVTEHAERHGLGKGAAVVDIAGRDSVPVAQVLSELNAWAALKNGTEVRGRFKESSGWVDGDAVQLKEPANLERITVMAGADVKVFARVKGGYALLPDARPFEAFKTPGLTPIRRAKPQESRPSSTIADAYEKGRLLSDLRSFRERGKRAAAFKAWERFQKTHRPEVVEATRAEAEAILEKIRRDAERQRRGFRSGGARR